MINYLDGNIEELIFNSIKRSDIRSEIVNFMTDEKYINSSFFMLDLNTEGKLDINQMIIKWRTMLKWLEFHNNSDCTDGTQVWSSSGMSS